MSLFAFYDIPLAAPKPNPSRWDWSRKGQSRMLSKGISAPSGLQCSHESISFSACRRVVGLTRTMFCPSGMGSKKSKNSGGMVRILYHWLGTNGHQGGNGHVD